MYTTSARRPFRLIALITVAVIVELLWVPPWAPKPEAHADGRGLDYSYGTPANVRHLGAWAQGTIYVTDVDRNKRWNVAKAARKLNRAGLDVQVGACPFDDRVDADGQPVYTNACVTVQAWSGATDSYGARRKAVVSLWSDGGRLIAADVSIDTRDARKLRKAKRERLLCQSLGRAAGLTGSQAKSVCR